LSSKQVKVKREDTDKEVKKVKKEIKKENESWEG